MPVELIDDLELVEALRPFRPDRAAFERGVQDYLRGRAALAAQDPLRNLPPLARAAAAVVPLPLLTGGKVSASATATSGGIGQKLLGIALFPAVSLFVLLGATILSIMGIRGTKFAPSSQQASPINYDAAIRGWWHDHWLPTLLMYAGAIALMYFGATGWIFPLLIASLGALVVVVRSLASCGLGNRTMLAGTLMTPLLLLFQLTSIFNRGDGSISLLDPRVVSYVFLAGVFCLGWISVRIPFGQGRINRNAGRLILFAMYFPISLLLLLQVRIPPSPDAIKQHVEAFDYARFGSATWRRWEIPARWTVEAGLNPDFSKPRGLLERELLGEQDRYILGIAFRVGLVAPADVAQLRDRQRWQRPLFELGKRDDPILSLGQNEWLIRAMLMTNELDDAKRDYLATRLHASLPHAAEAVFGPLRELLLITQLLAAIDRPVDPDQHRELVHAMLLQAHRTEASGFAPAGGFSSSLNSRGSDDDATADAVELMQIYGVPAELDINWVRSYAKPKLIGDSTRKWTDAITRNRLAALRSVQPPTVWQWLYYERNLLAAIILVGLCIYAVWISPVVSTSGATASLPSGATR